MLLIFVFILTLVCVFSLETVVETVVETVSKKVIVELPVVLEVDSILDKIGKYGINSITKEEKDFLDNLN